MTKVVLPNLGDNVEKAMVSYWYFKTGDKVKKDEDIVELTTDKATFNLPSPATGALSEILFSEGDTVKVGEVLAVIQEETSAKNA